MATISQIWLVFASEVGHVAYKSCKVCLSLSNRLCPVFQSCAVAFIEKVDGPALYLSPEEFEGYMLRQRAPTAGSKRHQVACETQNLLDDLKNRQEKLDQGMGALNVQLQTWVQTVHSQLDEATTQFSLVQKEITAQSAPSQVSSSQDSISQGEEIQDQMLLMLKDQYAGPKDTDC